MPAVSAAQQRFFGAILSYFDGRDPPAECLIEGGSDSEVCGAWNMYQDYKRRRKLRELKKITDEYASVARSELPDRVSGGMEMEEMEYRKSPRRSPRRSSQKSPTKRKSSRKSPAKRRSSQKSPQRSPRRSPLKK